MSSKVLLLCILYLCLTIAGCSMLHTKTAKAQTGKYTSSECEAALASLGNIWNEKYPYCPDNKRIVGFEIQNLVEKKGCLMGEPFSVVKKYLGVPDMTYKLSFQYNFDNSKKVGFNGNGYSSLMFDINQDSVITNFSVVEETTIQ